MAITLTLYSMTGIDDRYVGLSNSFGTITYNGALELPTGVLRVTNKTDQGVVYPANVVTHILLSSDGLPYVLDVTGVKSYGYTNKDGGTDNIVEFSTKINVLKTYFNSYRNVFLDSNSLVLRSANIDDWDKLAYDEIPLNHTRSDYIVSKGVVFNNIITNNDGILLNIKHPSLFVPGFSYIFNGVTSYKLGSADLDKVYKAFSDSENSELLSSFFSGMYIYPSNLQPLDVTQDVWRPVNRITTTNDGYAKTLIPQTKDGEQVGELSGTYYKLHVEADSNTGFSNEYYIYTQIWINSADYDNYLDLPPYKSYKFNIPYIGMVNFDMRELLEYMNRNNTTQINLRLIYQIDWSGAKIRARFEHSYTFSSWVSLPKVPMITSNQATASTIERLSRDMDGLNNVLRTVTGVAGAGLGITASALTGNGVGVAGGIIAGSEAIASGITDSIFQSRKHDLNMDVLSKRYDVLSTSDGTMSEYTMLICTTLFPKYTSLTQGALKGYICNTPFDKITFQNGTRYWLDVSNTYIQSFGVVKSDEIKREIMKDYIIL